MHHDPQFYRIRNHLVDFLVNRSRLIQGGSTDAAGDAGTGVLPPVVSPGLAANDAATANAA